MIRYEPKPGEKGPKPKPVKRPPAKKDIARVTRDQQAGRDYKTR